MRDELRCEIAYSVPVVCNIEQGTYPLPPAPKSAPARSLHAAPPQPRRGAAQRLCQRPGNRVEQAASRLPICCVCEHKFATKVRGASRSCRARRAVGAESLPAECRVASRLVPSRCRGNQQRSVSEAAFLFMESVPSSWRGDGILAHHSSAQKREGGSLAHQSSA